MIFPSSMCIYLYRHFDKLDDLEFKRTIGAMYGELNIKSGTGVIIHIVNFFLRRLMIPFSVVYSHDIIVQIYIMAATATV